MKNKKGSGKMDKYDILNVFYNRRYWEFEHNVRNTQIRLNSSSKLEEYSLYSLLIHSIDESGRVNTLELYYINTITFKDIGRKVEIRFYKDNIELVCIYTLYLETLNEGQLRVDLMGDNELLDSRTLLEMEELMDVLL